MSVRQGNSIIAGGIYIDNTPTSGSNNAVSSGGVYTALAGKVNTGHEVIEFQEPNAGNNYTWYRKYKDGWVEQGGHYTHNNVEGTVTINLPVTMADAHYIITMSKELGSDSATNMNYQFMCAYVMNSKTTTTFQIRMTGANRLNGADWIVSGMRAS